MFVQSVFECDDGFVADCVESGDAYVDREDIGYGDGFVGGNDVGYGSFDVTVHTSQSELGTNRATRLRESAFLFDRFQESRHSSLCAEHSFMDLHERTRSPCVLFKKHVRVDGVEVVPSNHDLELRIDVGDAEKSVIPIFCAIKYATINVLEEVKPTAEEVLKFQESTPGEERGYDCHAVILSQDIVTRSRSTATASDLPTVAVAPPPPQNLPTQYL